MYSVDSFIFRDTQHKCFKTRQKMPWFIAKIWNFYFKHETHLTLIEESEGKLHKTQNPTVKQVPSLSVVQVYRLALVFTEQLLWSKGTWEPRILFVLGIVETCKKRDSPWIKGAGMLGFAFVLLGPKNPLNCVFIYLCYLIIYQGVAVHYVWSEPFIIFQTNFML